MKPWPPPRTRLMRRLTRRRRVARLRAAAPATTEVLIWHGLGSLGVLVTAFNDDLTVAWPTIALVDANSVQLSVPLSGTLTVVITNGGAKYVTRFTDGRSAPPAPGRLPIVG